MNKDRKWANWRWYKGIKNRNNTKMKALYFIVPPQGK